MHAHGLRSLPEDMKHYDAVHELVQQKADLALPDVEVRMNRLRLIDHQTVEVPGTGRYYLNTWSRKQLASILGVRWNRWFEDSRREEIAEEVNRRLRRSWIDKKLRLCKDTPGHLSRADGVIRGIVGPTYTPIDDGMVFGCLAESCSIELQRARFIRCSQTEMSSQYAGIFDEPVNLGTNSPDWVFPGFSIRNSEVGFTSLTVDVFTFRLVCSNGMTTMVGGSRLLYRTHRPIQPDRLSKLLREAFGRLSGDSSATIEKLAEATRAQVCEPEQEIESLIRTTAIPRSFIPVAKEAFHLDPRPTRYGVIQSITDAAKQLSPEWKFEAEQLAGRYLTAA